MRFLLLILFILSSAHAKDNLISDPSFKKYKTEWWMGIAQEYRDYKYTFKRKVFKTELKHSSSPHYFSFATLIEPEGGSFYKFTIDLKCQGEGMIYMHTVNTVQGLDKKTRAAEIAKRQKQHNLGLHFKLNSFEQGWAQYTCYFKAKKNPYSVQNEAFHIMLGSYMGEIEIKNPSIEKVEKLPQGIKESIVSMIAIK